MSRPLCDYCGEETINTIPRCKCPPVTLRHVTGLIALHRDTLNGIAVYGNLTDRIGLHNASEIDAIRFGLMDIVLILCDISDLDLPTEWKEEEDPQ